MTGEAEPLYQCHQHEEGSETQPNADQCDDPGSEITLSPDDQQSPQATPLFRQPNMQLLRHASAPPRGGLLRPGSSTSAANGRGSGLPFPSLWISQGRTGAHPAAGLPLSGSPQQPTTDYSPSTPIAYAVSPWTASSPTRSVASSMRSGTMNEIALQMMTVMTTL